MPSSSPTLFDRRLVRMHTERARAYFSGHKALFECASDEIKERIADVAQPFSNILDLSPFPLTFQPDRHSLSATAITLDEEFLPFGPDTFDLVVSNLGLHWVNDVPGVLAQIKSILKPNGLFLASLIGGNSLNELRECLIEAEMLVYQGASPRVSPTIDLLTASQLMQRGGFSLPVVDKETIQVMYPTLFDLMRDLRLMGQANALMERSRTPPRRRLFFEAARLYQERYATSNGSLLASFELIYLHGWKSS